MYAKAIKTIHLEMTDKCNASCPQCARNILGGQTNPHLPLTELTLQDVRTIIPVEKVKDLDRLYMCGNYGDPIMARDTLEVFKYLRLNNPRIKLSINTNGSARDVSWWKELGETIGKVGNVKLGIDGLENTHEIYRRGTDFNKIIANAKALIETGVEVQWEYLVFKHNEHQIDLARSLAKELGFSKFTLKKTGRFFSNQTMVSNNKQEVFDKNGTLEYFLEKPTISEYQNNSLKIEAELIQAYGSMSKYFDQTPIDCKVIDEGSIYISAEGLIFPCCWTALQLYAWYSDPKQSQITILLNKYGGKSIIDGKKNSFDNIINSEFFMAIQKSWSCSGIDSGKLKVCAKTCGKKFDQFKDQYL